jgi:hypothetical protein
MPTSGQKSGIPLMAMKENSADHAGEHGQKRRSGHQVHGQPGVFLDLSGAVDGAQANDPHRHGHGKDAHLHRPDRHDDAEQYAQASQCCGWSHRGAVRRL